MCWKLRYLYDKKSIARAHHGYARKQPNVLDALHNAKHRLHSQKFWRYSSNHEAKEMFLLLKNTTKE